MKTSFKVISILSAFLCLFSLFPNQVFASDDKFVKMNVVSIDDSGNKNINKELFYYKDNKLYISNYTIIKYTMYDYDEKNNAFVRAGQTYNGSTSKITINESDNTVNVQLLFYNETYDCDIYKFGDFYFLPFDQISAYLKAVIAYYDENSVFITSSGYSIADAMYNFNQQVKFMNDIKIINDLFGDDETAYKEYCVLGYLGETIFDFKLSNIVGLGSYESYCDILEDAVNNNDVYNDVMDNDNLLLEVLNFTQDTLYEELYKKVAKVPKLESSAIVTMFEDYKENSTVANDSPFNNYFESEEMEIKPIKELGDTVKTISDYLETADYICDYFKMNNDNKSALEYISSTNSNSVEMLAISDIGNLYSNNFVEAASNELITKIGKKCISEVVKEAGLSKIKLATNITNDVFKLFGFDLSDNSAYNIMLANDLKRVILDNCTEYTTEKLLTPTNSENLRLTMIMTLLVEIEAYDMANKVAKRTGLSGYYDDDIDYLNKILALFYKAKESQNYDDFESMEKLYEDNQQQLKKYDLTDLDSVSQDEAENMLMRDKLSEQFFENYADTVVSFITSNVFEAETDYGMMRIIDVNMDGYPDLTLSQFSCGGGHGGITNVYLYKSGTFEEIKLADDFVGTYLQITTDSNGNKFISNGEPEPYNIANDFYTPSVFGKVEIQNDELCIDVIYDEFSESNTPKKYLKAINKNYQFEELSDDSTINFYFYINSESKCVFKLESSEEEIHDLVVDYFNQN